jgi:hypothetical protein
LAVSAVETSVAVFGELDLVRAGGVGTFCGDRFLVGGGVAGDCETCRFLDRAGDFETDGLDCLPFRFVAVRPRFAGGAGGSS